MFNKFFGCGKNYLRSTNNRCYFMVQKRSDIIDKIIPFFNEYPLVSIKTLDFDDFSKALSLHGHQGWKESVKVIIEGMNSKRKF